MGKKVAAEICKINNRTQRNVTFKKRTRGLLHKVKEISMLCDRYVYLILFDAETGKLVQFKSHDHFDWKAVGELMTQ